jgi:hypothetical protein
MPQSKQEINQRYREKNREKIQESNKLYRENNKEKIAESNKLYREKNREAIKEYNKKYKKIYHQTEKVIKSTRISCWRLRCIIDEDLSAVYDYYIKQTHCMICLKEYKDSSDRSLDHDHQTGEIRYIVCRNCNTNFLREKNIS